MRSISRKKKMGSSSSKTYGFLEVLLERIRQDHCPLYSFKLNFRYMKEDSNKVSIVSFLHSHLLRRCHWLRRRRSSQLLQPLLFRPLSTRNPTPFCSLCSRSFRRILFLLSFFLADLLLHFISVEDLSRFEFLGRGVRGGDGGFADGARFVHLDA